MSVRFKFYAPYDTTCCRPLCVVSCRGPFMPSRLLFSRKRSTRASGGVLILSERCHETTGGEFYFAAGSFLFGRSKFLLPRLSSVAAISSFTWSWKSLLNPSPVVFHHCRNPRATTPLDSTLSTDSRYGSLACPVPMWINSCSEFLAQI